MNKERAKKNRAVRLLALFLAVIGLLALLFAALPLVLKRMYPIAYEDIIERCSENYDVPSEIICAVIYTESSFREKAVSSRGASGLMQLMPDTFDWIYGKLPNEIKIDDGGANGTNGSADSADAAMALAVKNDIFDPETNIVCGTYLLRMLYKEFQDWDVAFAAYNAGMGRVRGWLKDEQYCKDGKLVVIPFEETSKYVERVDRAINIYKKLYEL